MSPRKVNRLHIAMLFPVSSVKFPPGQILTSPYSAGGLNSTEVDSYLLTR